MSAGGTLHVSVSYESPAFHEEASKRKKKAVGDGES